MIMLRFSWQTVMLWQREFREAGRRLELVANRSDTSGDAATRSFSDAAGLRVL
jgi:hypothetical protein